MNKANFKRKINRNLFFAKMQLAGLTEHKLGQQMNPPVRRSRVCQIITSGVPLYRLKEIAGILKSNVQTLFPKTIKEDDNCVE